MDDQNGLSDLWTVKVRLRKLASGPQLCELLQEGREGAEYPIHSWLGRPFIDASQIEDLVSCIDRVLCDRLFIQLQFQVDIP